MNSFKIMLCTLSIVGLVASTSVFANPEEAKKEEHKTTEHKTTTKGKKGKTEKHEKTEKKVEETTTEQKAN